MKVHITETKKGKRFHLAAPGAARSFCGREFSHASWEISLLAVKHFHKVEVLCYPCRVTALNLFRRYNPEAYKANFSKVFR